MNIDWTRVSRSAFDIRLRSAHRERHFEETKGYPMIRAADYLTGGHGRRYFKHRRSARSAWSKAPSQTARVALRGVRILMRNTEKKYRFRTQECS